MFEEESDGFSDLIGDIGDEEDEDEDYEEEGLLLGASLLTTPPKRIATPSADAATAAMKKGRRYSKKPGLLQEVMKGTQKARMEKEREKDRFKEAGWVRVEEVEKYEWPLFTVPMELQKMTLDLPERFVACNLLQYSFINSLFHRHNTTRLSVFQLYLSDSLLRLLLERRREEMEQGWSSKGYGIQLDVQAVKMVRKIFLNFMFYLTFPFRCWLTLSTSLGPENSFLMKGKSATPIKGMPSKMLCSIF